tara:strand:+ start:3027 stop:3410 length:384 start_codon:yes stop_codon:yes gene_type:complete
MNARLLAQILYQAKKLGFAPGKPAVSPLIRQILQAFAGPESEWLAADSDQAIAYLQQQGFHLKQFSTPGPRWFEGKAREDMFNTHVADTSEPSPKELRIQELIEKSLTGESLTPEEESEWTSLTDES